MAQPDAIAAEIAAAQPLVTAINNNDPVALQQAYQQLPNEDVLSRAIDLTIGHITVPMALALVQLMPPQEADDTVISGAFVNGRIDIMNALVARGWVPNDEWLGAHLFILADAANESMLDARMVQAAQWLITTHFVQSAELPSRYAEVLPHN